MSNDFIWRPVKRPPSSGTRAIDTAPAAEAVQDTATLKPVSLETYGRVVARLYRESTERRSSDPEMPATITDLDVVNDLTARASEYQDATYRLYRAALQWHFTRRLEATPPEWHAGIHAARAALEAYQFVASPDLPERTSAGRRKNVTLEDIGRLLNSLNNGRATRASWKLRAAHWLLASLCTGLRPSEWETAQWLDGSDQSQLYVQNAKWRADQPDVNRFRVVEVDKEYQLWVTVHMASIKAALAEGYTFRQAYDHCRAALRRAVEQLWGNSKQISLYTMRGQFSSNAKAQMPLVDVSALMGHANPRTTQRNYGKRRYAHAGAVVPRPPQEHQMQAMEQGEQAHEQEGDEPSARFASLMRYSA